MTAQAVSPLHGNARDHPKLIFPNAVSKIDLQTISGLTPSFENGRTRLLSGFHRGLRNGFPRRCWRIKRLKSKSRNDLLLVKIEPPLIGQKYGLGDRDIDLVLIAPRHKNASLFPINMWPLYVYVARLLIVNPEGHDDLSENEFESIAWAELYRTEEEARLKAI